MNAGPLVVGAHFDEAGAVDYAFDGLMDELGITDILGTDLADAPDGGGGRDRANDRSVPLHPREITW